MRRKLIESIKKLMRTELTSHQVHVYFNIYMLKSVFFGCGVVSLIKREENEMKRTCETPMLKKLGLSTKLPREVMYVRKTALGLGLIEPCTVLSILTLKQYFGHMRMGSDTSNITKANEELLQLENGRSKHHMDIRQSEKYWTRTWIDEASDQCNKRTIQIQNRDVHANETTTNATIMDYACTYVREKRNSKEITEMINHVRMHKQLYFPFEIVSMCGSQKTNCVENDDEISPMRWCFCKKRVEKPSIKCFRKWRKFVEWLKARRVQTKIDFKVEGKCRWVMSESNEVIRCQNEKGKVEYYEKPEY